MRRPVLLLLVLALTLALGVTAVSVTSAATGPVAHAAKAGKKKKGKRKKQRKCVYARVGGKRTCLRLGARCRPVLRPTYLTAKLDCRKRRLRKASPAARRQGRYINLSPSGEPTLTQAKQAFAASVAPLPGVKVPKGTVAPTFDGTTALLWLQDYQGELTRAQRRVLDAALQPAPSATVVPVDANGFLPGEAPAPTPAPTSSPIPEPSATPTPTPTPTPPPVLPAQRPAAREHAQTPAEFDALVREIIPRLRAKGLVVRHGVSVSFLSQAKGTTQADAFPGWLSGDPARTTCQVRIYPAAQQSSVAYQRQVIAHELTHCVQYESLTSTAQLGASPGWILDGTAEYVAYNVAIEMNGFLPDPGWWPTWMRQPTGPLFGRQYDAVGFWSLLASRGANVYALIDPVVRAGATGGSSRAYAVATAGVDRTFLTDWGSTTAAYAPLGPNWLLRGPGVKAPEVSVQTVGEDGPPLQFDFAAKGAVSAALSVKADVVNIGVSDGVSGRLHLAGGADQALRDQQDFCAKEGGCDCPDGEPSPASKYPKLRGGGAVTFLGAANPDAAGHVTVTGTSLDALCKKKDKDDDKGDKGGGKGVGKGKGLEIRDNESLSLLGSITTGTCRFSGGNFVATGRGSGYTFRMVLAGVRKPGKYAGVDFSKGANTMQIRGRGSFSSKPPFEAVVFGGAAIYPKVVRSKGGKILSRYVLSAGAQPLFSGSTPAVVVIPGKGGLRC